MTPINFNNAMKAYQAAMDNVTAAEKGIAAPARSTAAGAADGAFSRMFTDAVGRAETTIAKSEQASMQAIAGQIDLQSMVDAINRADMLVSAITSVRDKAVTAYNQIMNMQI
ncbi:MAG: flagellar hook-basal body complex protein FliE [Alphaproteobacteria bacterium]|nr:flagellar hook-basal body complex protein FliE [Alphaproteobacteria bacterium]